jgi:DNA-binding transcriptional LysR family regulator
MDVTQARTFLAILETGSFLRAADKVNVAQSTVSARIKALEDLLGQPLFERNKAGAVPTRAGRDFARHAAAMVQMWDQAKLAVALPEGRKSMLAIGGQPSLWDGFLLKWLARMQKAAPEVAIQAQMRSSSRDLMQQVTDGLIDIAVLYRPEARPGFVVRQIFEEHLVMAASPALPGGGEPRYIYIDWGPEFQADHALNFPESTVPGISLDLGTLGVSFLLDTNASGYFPLRTVAPLVAAGALQLRQDQPVFTYPVYAVFAEERDATFIDAAVRELTETALAELPGAPH